MSEKSSFQTKLEQASYAIEKRKFAEGNSLADESLEFEPTNSLAWVIKGICLARLGEADHARNAYAKAIEFDPTNARPHFNLAVFLVEQKDPKGALVEAKKAVKLDSTHEDAKALVRKLKFQLGLPIEDAEKPAPWKNPFVKSKEVELEVLNVDSFPWVPKSEPYWTYLGYFLATVLLVTFVSLISIYYPQLQNGSTSFAKPTKLTTLEFLISIGYWTGLILTLVFSFIDVLNKRRNSIWIVSILILSCIFLGWIPLYSYLIFGRRTQT